MNRILSLSAATLVAAALSVHLNAQAPPEILALNDLQNAGQLYLEYCLPGTAHCATRKAICYGQCCDQYTADDMGYGCSGDIEGIVPSGYKYHGWSCRQFESGKVLTGKATKNYDTKGCHNPR